MQDAWRAYLELAMGLTEAPRKKAQEAVRRLVGTGGATAAQLQSLAEELMSTSAANREALTKLVRFEVDRALGAVGLATADEVAELTRRVHELERQLREARTAPAAEGAPVSTATGTGAAVGGPGPVAPGTAGARATPGAAEPAAATPTSAAGPDHAAPAKKAVAKKAIAKKAVKKAVAGTAAAEDAASGETAASKAAKKAVAKKAVAVRRPTDVAPAGEPPAPAKKAPRKQQPGGPA
ncbi:hypothetical protein [Micromonospora sp. NPDC126480]|uniref:phasin family protein n=1 Tax=Micromonospora sp. NPDC126480 TaxID=3155312 RepID=UPI00331961FD